MQGKERREINDESFYEQIAYVTHKPSILKGTIRDNLQMADIHADDTAMWKVLEKTCLKDFIEEQGGLDMQLLENGNNLSGGQRQRLSLARALLADRDIYIFDEATSNIDIESEEAILNVITALAKTKTIIMITHRLHNIVNSDKIYVLHNGSCVEHGTHNELMQLQKQYHKMFEKQSELEQMEGDEAYA